MSPSSYSNITLTGLRCKFLELHLNSVMWRFNTRKCNKLPSRVSTNSLSCTYITWEDLGKNYMYTVKKIEAE